MSDYVNGLVIISDYANGLVIISDYANGLVIVSDYVKAVLEVVISVVPVVSVASVVFHNSLLSSQVIVNLSGGKGRLSHVTNYLIIIAPLI